MEREKNQQAHGRYTFGELVRQFRVREHFSQQTLATQLGIHRNTIARWEQGDYLPKTRVALHELAQVLRLNDQESNLLLEAAFFPKDESTVHPAAAAAWTVPYQRNAFFTGRDELLHEVHTRLSRDHTMALTQSWAISGLGGIGKTQIALEYAYRYRHEYRFVFWLSAATQETLLASLVMIAELLHLPEQDTHDHTRLIRAVKEWFASQQQWLVILDNVEDIAVLQNILPTEYAGHVLLTTRAQALGALAQRIDVETMGMAEATLFLLRRARLLAPEALLDQAMQGHLDAAETIAIEMDFLPLALDQAGAYIEEVGCSLSTYLDRYRTHRKALLQRRGHVPTDHPEPVATTWSLSFEKIEQTNPVAAELLRFCAFLEPDAIPEELINEGSAHLGPILGPVATDALKVDEAIQELRAFSLVQRDPEARLLRVHRLVQAVLKDTMKTGDVQQWAERVVRITETVFPPIVERATWSQCQRYLPQAQECALLIQDYGFTFEEAASLLFRTASYVQEYALYEQAELLYQQALRIWEQIFGPDHIQVAYSLQRLAHLSYARGRYEQAEALFQRTLHIRLQVLGAGHPDVAETLDGLAAVYDWQKKYEQAEALFQRALHIYQQALGSEHPDIARLYNHLGNLYIQLGKYEQAELLFQEAVSIWKHAPGSDNADMSRPLANLALCYAERGDFESAEPLYMQALDIWEQVLGANHPHVAHCFHGLATIYYQQGTYEQAELFAQRTLHIREQILGADHPEVAYTLNLLAAISKAQGRYEQAEALFQRTLHIFQQALGLDHPEVTRPLNNLGNLYMEQGQYEQAMPLYQHALSISEQALGVDHPYLAHPLHGLAKLYMKQGKYEQAMPLYQRALAIREQHLEQHPDKAETLHDFATLYVLQGNYPMAEDLYHRALVIHEHVFGPQHPTTLETRERLQTVLAVLDKTNEVIHGNR